MAPTEFRESTSTDAYDKYYDLMEDYREREVEEEREYIKSLFSFLKYKNKFNKPILYFRIIPRARSNC